MLSCTLNFNILIEMIKPESMVYDLKDQFWITSREIWNVMVIFNKCKAGTMLSSKTTSLS